MSQPSAERGTRVRLRAPRNQLDPRAVGWWRTRSFGVCGAAVAVLIVLGLLVPPARTWLLSGGVAAAVAGAVFVGALPRWWYRVHRWEVTDSAVYVRTGHFWQEWRVAPMSRIQTVDTQRGPLEQLFGLATVTVTTASSKGDVRIEGLDEGLAADLAEELTQTTQATPGDAT